MMPRWLNRITRRAIAGSLVETVTLLVRDRSNDVTATYAAWNVPRVIVQERTGGEVALDGVMTSELPHRPFVVYLADLQEAVAVLPAVGVAPVPQSGDLIKQSDGTTWIIEKVTSVARTEVFNCDCILRPAGTP